MTGIKAFPVSRGDERIHPRLGKFDHELALDEHGKDLIFRTNSLLIAKRSQGFLKYQRYQDNMLHSSSNTSCLATAIQEEACKLRRQMDENP